MVGKKFGIFGKPKEQVYKTQGEIELEKKPEDMKNYKLRQPRERDLVEPKIFRYRAELEDIKEKIRFLQSKPWYETIEQERERKRKISELAVQEKQILSQIQSYKHYSAVNGSKTKHVLDTGPRPMNFSARGPGARNSRKTGL
jgi:hypothetical protein